MDLMNSFYTFKPWFDISTEDGIYRCKVLEAQSHTPDQRPVIMMLTHEEKRKNLRAALQEVLPLIATKLKLLNYDDAVWIGDIKELKTKDGFSRLNGFLIGTSTPQFVWGAEKTVLDILKDVHDTARSLSLHAPVPSHSFG